MSRQVSPVSGKPYGLAMVCWVWRLARCGVYRHRAPQPVLPQRRPGPSGAMPDADLVQAIREVLVASLFHGEGHRKVWCRLRHAGIRTAQDALEPARRQSPPAGRCAVYNGTLGSGPGQRFEAAALSPETAMAA